MQKFIISFYLILCNIKHKNYSNSKRSLFLFVFIFHSFIKLVNIISKFVVICRKSHIVSFIFSFFFLLVISRLGDYIGLPVPSTHTNLILMILTLKLSGLAFELNAAINPPADDPEGVDNEAIKNVGFLDVFHYGFGYMGLLTGNSMIL